MSFLSVRKLADASLPTRWGNFRILGFEGVVENPIPCKVDTPAPATRVESAVALVMGDVYSAPPIVRVHSSCLTGDVFHSLRCDCRDQLELALATIAAAGAGIVLYENQEGRGIGLMAKLQAYELQEQGRDTIEANLELGYAADCRHFELPAAILNLLKIPAVRRKWKLSRPPASRSASVSGPTFLPSPPLSVISKPSAKKWGTWSVKCNPILSL